MNFIKLAINDCIELLKKKSRFHLAIGMSKETEQKMILLSDQQINFKLEEHNGGLKGKSYRKEDIPV